MKMVYHELAQLLPELQPICFQAELSFVHPILQMDGVPPQGPEPTPSSLANLLEGEEEMLMEDDEWSRRVEELPINNEEYQ